MDKISIIVCGIIIFLMSFVAGSVITTDRETITIVGELQNVRIQKYDATLTFDTQNVTFNIGKTQLQIPLEIGQRYQIDILKTTSFFGAVIEYHLQSVTKLP